MKYFLLFTILLTSNKIFAQKIKYTDLVTFSMFNTDKSAELLFSKNFSLVKAFSTPWIGKNFEYKKGEERISIEFDDYSDGGMAIQSCFSEKFDSDFKLLEDQVKSNFKKIRFFFYKGIGIYLTEYKLGNAFLYIGRGLCSSVKTDFKYGTFLITNKRYD